MTWRSHIRSRLADDHGDHWSFHGYVSEWRLGDASPWASEVISYGVESKMPRIVSEVEAVKFVRRDPFIEEADTPGTAVIATPWESE